MMIYLLPLRNATKKDEQKKQKIPPYQNNTPDRNSFGGGGYAFQTKTC
jgi:hypothetical protein